MEMLAHVFIQGAKFHMLENQFMISARTPDTTLDFIFYRDRPDLSQFTRGSWRWLYRRGAQVNSWPIRVMFGGLPAS